MPTIAHISDLHFHRIDGRIAAALVDELHARVPSLVVISGDLTQRARRSQFRAAGDYLRRLPQPQLVIPGNHDVPLFDLPRRFFAPLTRYRRYITPELDPVYRGERLLVVGLNTARSFTWKEGRISPGQMLAARQQLCAAPATVFKVIVTHHPFLPVPGEPRTVLVGRGLQTLSSFEACGVDLLLAGHLHLGYSGDVRSHHATLKSSVLAVQAGTAISTRRRGNEPNAYNWITLEPDRVDIRVRAWTGERFEDAAWTRYARREGVWGRVNSPLERP